MIVSIESLSKRYAQAFISVHEKFLNEAVINVLGDFMRFLHKHNWCLTYLSLSSFSREKKHAFIVTLTKHFKLDKPFGVLIETLITHGRIDFLPLIIKHIISQYYKEHNIVKCSVTSSHELSEQEQVIIKNFLIAALPGKHAQLTFAQDSKLIVGIRLKGETFLWERSVYKMLQQMKHHFSKQVQL